MLKLLRLSVFIVLVVVSVPVVSRGPRVTSTAAPTPLDRLRTTCRRTSPVSVDGGTSFNDVASKTVLADVVFEGRTVQSTPSTVDSRFYDVQFTVTKLIKGSLSPTPLQPDTPGAADLSTPVLVGLFGGSANGSTSVIDGGCVAPPVKLNSNYVIFVLLGASNDVIPPLTSTSSAVYYRISGLPEASSKKTLKEATENSCARCVAKSPTVRLSTKQAEVEANKRLQLECKGQGQPAPRYTWFKDDRPLVADKLIRITNNKRGSRLQIAKTRDQDAGSYNCRATNVLGFTDAKSVQVSVKSVTAPAPPAHSQPCSTQGYCLNGGTCYMFSDLQMKYCQCPSVFTGPRCQEKQVTPVTPPTARSQDRFTFHWNVDSRMVLIMIGSVIIFLILLALIITAFCLMKTSCSNRTTSEDREATEKLVVPIRDNADRISEYRNANSLLPLENAHDYCTPLCQTPITVTDANVQISDGEILARAAATGHTLASVENSKPVDDGNNNSKTMEANGLNNRTFSPQRGAELQTCANNINDPAGNSRTPDVQNVPGHAENSSQNAAVPIAVIRLRNSCGYPCDSDPEATVI